MKITVINGSPKKSGFISGTLDLVSEYLHLKGVEVRRHDLKDRHILDCTGCFTCLTSGECVIKDDMENISADLLDADGIVIGSPVRNSNITALYKRFYERITYRLGFPLLLENKHALAISSVGVATGRQINKKLLGLQDVCHAHLSGFEFFKVGIPSKTTPESIKARIEKAVDVLMEDIRTGKTKGLSTQIGFWLDRTIMKNFMFKKQPEFYANVIKNWKEKGYY